MVTPPHEIKRRTACEGPVHGHERQERPVGGARFDEGDPSGCRPDHGGQVGLQSIELVPKVTRAHDSAIRRLKLQHFQTGEVDSRLCVVEQICAIGGPACQDRPKPIVRLHAQTDRRQPRANLLSLVCQVLPHHCDEGRDLGLGLFQQSRLDFSSENKGENSQWDQSEDQEGDAYPCAEAQRPNPPGRVVVSSG